MPSVKPLFTSPTDGLPQPLPAPANGQLLVGDGVGYTPATITAGAGVTVSNGAGSVTVGLPNVGTPGTYGSAALIPAFTTDAQGRITAVTTYLPQFSTVSYLPSASQNITLASQQFTTTTSFHVLVNTSGGTITMSSTPIINSTPAAVAGQVLVLFNSRASTNTITVGRGVPQALALSTASRQLTPGAMLSLIYDGSVWIETAFSTAST